MNVKSRSIARSEAGSQLYGNAYVRYSLLAFGWVSVAAGLAGLVVPLFPTTVCLLLALWAFSKSSDRVHDWLYSHPRLGPPLRAWCTHRVIPLRAKVLSVATMAASVLAVAMFAADGWALPLALGALLSGVAAYILTRPHRLPL